LKFESHRVNTWLSERSAFADRQHRGPVSPNAASVIYEWLLQCTLSVARTRRPRFRQQVWNWL